MTLEDRILAFVKEVGLDIKAIKNNQIKGFVTLTFLNSNEQKILIPNANVNANSVISVNIENTNDEIFVEDFQIQIVKEPGLGFIIFCRPRIGTSTKKVILNYLIQ